MQISLIGSGWLGFPLARFLARSGQNVAASTTGSSKLHTLAQAGVEPIELDLGKELDIPRLHHFFEADWLIITAPPTGVADYPAGLAAASALARRRGTRRILMTSSTSVYPNLQRVVTEDDAGPRGGYSLKRNGEAVYQGERAIEESGLPTTILRLAGLYGYGRHPARYLAGRRDLPDGDAPVNLVHRDDVVRTVQAVIAGDRTGIYNVVSPDHPTRAELYTEVAAKLGLVAPTFLPGRDRGWKIVSDERLQREVAPGPFQDPRGWSAAEEEPRGEPD